MVARGDLGVELPVARVPLVQMDVVEKAHQLGKPVVIATQILDSMTDRPVPTRAEVSDIANSILDGADALMVTGETAIGDSLNTGVFTAKKYLKVHMKGKASSDISFKLQFNGDEGTTYSFRNSLNSATDPSPDTGASYLNVGTSFTGTIFT